jgi:hypothetical protein
VVVVDVDLPGKIFSLSPMIDVEREIYSRKRRVLE